MPLTSDGRKVLAKFINQYGAEKGKAYFYAYMKKYPERTKSWYEKREKELTDVPPSRNVPEEIQKMMPQGKEKKSQVESKDQYIDYVTTHTMGIVNALYEFDMREEITLDADAIRLLGLVEKLHPFQSERWPRGGKLRNQYIDYVNSKTRQLVDNLFEFNEKGKIKLNEPALELLQQLEELHPLQDKARNMTHSIKSKYFTIA